MLSPDSFVTGGTGGARRQLGSAFRVGLGAEKSTLATPLAASTEYAWARQASAFYHFGVMNSLSEAVFC
jgi:hypothetical protein